MIIKITNSGNKIEITDTDLLQLPSLSNVLLVGSGVNKIVDDRVIRHSLFKTFQVGGILYLLCADGRDPKSDTLYVDAEQSSDNMIGENLREIMDPSLGFEFIQYNRR